MKNKDLLLKAIGEHGPIENAIDLIVPVGNQLGVHSIVHLIWSCQKLGLLTFSERKNGHTRYPAKIQLTQKGREYVARNT